MKDHELSAVECVIPATLQDVPLPDVSRVMQYLRPQFSVDELSSAIVRQWQSGYRLAVAYCDGLVVGVAGFVLGEKLAWGKHMYIDDLVVDESMRSKGIGDALLQCCQTHAESHGCVSLHLDSGTQRTRAHGFYFAHGMPISSFHFNKSIG
ncbi:GNAT family N-acetyltransferase [Aestuariibacter sp. GS-14]|uniref:GNAT family N-acetyltransferase n=1 Tax=Aestuariibacter sp. GS-14 TaxID=2590670 RepID=UPI001126FBBF|nr:GNAT family N-acetyltransferase [Aestuariibacter sp. GS-14]TPV61054.1 GNAT family N-acetyltransferase [Aestuariibacter sp. GS-14]